MQMIYETVIKCGPETYVHVARKEICEGLRMARDYESNKDNSIDEFRKELSKRADNGEVNQRLNSLIQDHHNNSVYCQFYIDKNLFAEQEIADLLKTKIGKWHENSGRTVISRIIRNYNCNAIEVDELFNKIMDYKRSHNFI